MGSILERYGARFAEHATLAERARSLLPDGVTSDSRHLEPFPLYIEAAAGARKWDAAGREFIDLWSGHGALLFGHAAPELLTAARAQLEQGTHFGACHRSAATWAARITEALPAAERVRFTASGTEAVLLALHLARAYTGRAKILRFVGHYHGWYADLSVGSSERGDRGHDPVIARARELVLTCPHDLDTVAATLAANPDVGAVILEPTGPCSGVVPLPPGFVSRLRELTHEHAAVLIFDEIVTGFRLSEGGAQALLGVDPDLTTLAKVTCGGLSGGALAGRRELLALLEKGAGAGLRAPELPSLPHLGTFSGNPLSAAAGIATLERIAAERPYPALARTGQALREALNHVIDQRGLDWLAYGEGSCVKLLVGHGVPKVRALELEPATLGEAVLLARGRAATWELLRLALLLEGVDMSRSSFVTTAHSERDIEAVALAFDRAIAALAREGALR